MNSLETKIKLNPKSEKFFKKLYGKNLGREIAMGRKLVKLMKRNMGNDIKKLEWPPRII